MCSVHTVAGSGSVSSFRGKCKPVPAKSQNEESHFSLWACHLVQADMESSVMMWQKHGVTRSPASSLKLNVFKAKRALPCQKKTTRYFQSRPTRIWNNNLQEGGSQKRNCRAIGTCWFSKVGLNRSPYSCVGEEEIISPRPLLLLPGLLRVHGKLPSHLSPLKSGFGSAPDCRRPLLFLSPPALPFQAHPTSLTPTLVLFALPNLPAKPVPLLSGKESSPHPGECQLQPVTSILHYRDTL